MEGELNYASIVFKANKPSASKAKREEETVYDDVKVQGHTADLNTDTQGFLGEKPVRGRHGVQLVACCLGSLCVILVATIITLCFYFSAARNDSDAQVVQQLKENNLTSIINNLSSEITDLKKNSRDQTVLIGDLRQNNSILTSESQQLQMEKSALERQVKKLRRERTELSLTRTQRILDAYCPKTGDKEERRCNPCQEGWLLSPSKSSCYLVVTTNNYGKKTWEEAREDCRQRNADLVVIENGQEQEFIRETSLRSSNSTLYRFWIGLRRTSGVWKWVDGSDLTESYWINQPLDNTDCAVSVQWSSPEGWRAKDYFLGLNFILAHVAMWSRTVSTHLASTWVMVITEFIRGISHEDGDSSLYGYWIGLRRTSGVWKWVDGSDLTER
ncbi:C-type lectin domain family 12 member B-like [Myripristis murdjan]|uniref:C-type lectin domain family 12 member B-like n=1 Tax=Myripristis murdjan TaxID=586833 RepID=UPI0011763279|nr:C-type lectin domain family 12 member B-like [Myripristis murdjan]